VDTDGTLGPGSPLPHLGGAQPLAMLRASGDVALAFTHERAVDNCFSCQIAAHGRLAPAGTLTESWPIPFVDHYASSVSSFAEIDQTLYVTWDSISPAFYVPVWFTTLARDPGDILFTVPWSGGMRVTAGGPRDGVLGFGVSSPGSPIRRFLHAFSTGGGFALSDPCTIDLGATQLLPAPGGKVLVVGAGGRALVVSVPP
jgi:hypothetical protein